MSKPKLVVLSGAGISAESGIKTFRDHDGLWENYRIEDVATPEAWNKNRELVQRFYNDRRRNLQMVHPNAAHLALVELESRYEVFIVTQNVDDLHERAGSSKVVHLHGELLKARSTADEHLVYPWTGDLGPDDRCEKGSPLRPHIVWFGEAVPLIETAARLVQSAEVLLVVGTSLSVYPAAGLLYYASFNCKKYYIDPQADSGLRIPNLKTVTEKASIGVRQVVDELLKYE